jgi:4-amino-4-deoxy-L-arabinose transferase-like glycosyltransferase
MAVTDPTYGTPTSEEPPSTPDRGRVFSVVALVAILAAGCALRAASFVWNERLQGDVNLFALTARELLEHGALQYPFTSSLVAGPDPSLTTPASQHPPLFPVAGAALAKVIGTRDTFFALKVLCELAGLALIVIVAAAGWRSGWRTEALVVSACLAVSPLMVDFSANGSPYILGAIFVVLVSLLLWRWKSRTLAPFIAAGILAGLAYELHGTMVSVSIAFVLYCCLTRPAHWLKGLVLSLVVALVVASPYLIWNLRHFGNPVYTSSMNFPVLTVRGAAADDPPEASALAVAARYLSHYAVLVVKFQARFLGHLALEIGPFAAILAAFGARRLLRRDRRAAAALLLPALCFYGVVFLWPTVQLRYMVPLLPAVYVLSALGLTTLSRGRLRHRVMSALLLAGLVLWNTWSYLAWPHTRYYLYARDYARLYDKMVPIARRLEELPRGTTLSCAEDPIPPVYWHGQPTVTANLDPERWRIDAARFGARYVWTDSWGNDIVRTAFPGARLVLGNDAYKVYDLAAAPEAR